MEHEPRPAYRATVNRGRDALTAAGFTPEEAARDARLLLEWVCGTDQNTLLLEPGRALTPEDAARYDALISRRTAHVPLQQLTGRQCFMGLDFIVTPDVLVPRADTEVLVEAVLGDLADAQTMPAVMADAAPDDAARAGAAAMADAQTMPAVMADAAKNVSMAGMQTMPAGADGEGRPGRRILDLCTGSGCILLSIIRLLSQQAGAVPDLMGVGCDISFAALDVAKENARRLLRGQGAPGCVAESPEVYFYQGDLYEALPRGLGRFDVIVSNPPYIASDVIGELMPEVRDHEPRIALDGGRDGLDYYRRIIAGARGHLVPGGRIYLEIGYDQGAAVQEMLHGAGFCGVAIMKDYAGLDRVASAAL